MALVIADRRAATRSAVSTRFRGRPIQRHQYHTTFYQRIAVNNRYYAVLGATDIAATSAVQR